MLRTHTNGDLRAADVGKAVTLCGWVQSRRDHGGVIFIDLRDRYGLTQIVFDPSYNAATHKVAERLSREDCLQATGEVRRRKPGMENPKLDTGQVEVFISGLSILGKARTPPIEVDDLIETSDEVRLRYRYLDLRRPQMQRRLRVRAEAARAAREYLHARGFLEVETPLLMKSTPEGARDYVVPSRLHPGKCYALPQSPQIYKQILMVAGCDRYFQFARCLRDEDLRADRQPEHTQIDLEMSFVEVDDLLAMFEGLIAHLFATVKGATLPLPFPRLSYAEAMRRFGTDKPDLRFGLELFDATAVCAKSGFGIFRDLISRGGLVKGLAPRKAFSRTELEELIAFAQQLGSKGLVWMRVSGGQLESNIAKFFSAQQQAELITLAQAPEGSVLLLVAGEPKLVNDVLSRLRLRLGRDLGLVLEGAHAPCFVTDFPLFETNDQGKLEPAHHMFCMPKREHLPLLDTDPAKVLCTQYDLVLNGWELGSGSLRITDPAVQEKVMRVIGLAPEELRQKFGFLLEAFAYGAPPHGGIGLGFDRIVALLLDLQDIREVIAFPKNKAAENPMDGSPSPFTDEQLKELHLKVTGEK